MVSFGTVFTNENFLIIAMMLSKINDVKHNCFCISQMYFIQVTFSGNEKVIPFILPGKPKVIRI